jgi:hypothetical protein
VVTEGPDGGDNRLNAGEGSKMDVLGVTHDDQSTQLGAGVKKKRIIDILF